MEGKMGRAILALALLLAIGVCHAQSIAWKRGRWFDGGAFVAGTRWSVDGIFVRDRPAHIDREEDLAHRYVVPPYGDAHHHGIDSTDGLADKITVFLEAGIFYVKNPNGIAELITPEVRSRLNLPQSVDVTFAYGGLTSSGGHPEPLHHYLASLGVFPGLKPEDMEGRAYFSIDNEADLDAKWPRILAAKPDFIKTFLLFTDKNSPSPGSPSPLGEGRGGGDGRGGGHHGLDPQVLKAIVRRAHGAGLRVSTHIDTAGDFRQAVDAGVDEINHLPQPDQRYSPDLSAYVIDAATARLAASRGITVVTTASTTERLSPHLPAEWIPAMRANQVANLRTLQDAGVKLAIGSDAISGERRFVTARDEVKFLSAHKMLDRLALLRAWSVNTPKAIFPDRKLGELRDGFEASFLVLADDPLDDADNLHRIAMRVKQGHVLPAMPAIVLGR
jgi:cytosine/adenosine deaminase-related metal-dependent hydrolase